MLILLLISVVGAELVSLYLPIIYKNLIDALTTSVPGDPASQAHLISYIYWIMWASLLGWCFHRLDGYTATYVVSRVMSNLLNTCFAYLHKHSYAFFNNSLVGSLVTRVNRFSRAYEDLFDEIIWDIIPAILNITIVLFVLGSLQSIFGWILIVWTALFITSNFNFMRYKLRYDLANSAMESETTGQIADTISNQINLKLFASTKQEFKDFHKTTEKLKKAREKTWYFDTTSSGVHGFMLVILEVSVMYLAIHYWAQGLITIGEVTLIQVYLVKLTSDIWGIGRYFRNIFEALADAQEMTKILSTPHEIIDQNDAKKLEVTNGEIVFSNVTFAYNNKAPILKDFNLTIPPGERLALIGKSGGGKTTIVKLLFRFFDLQSGNIAIDSQSITEVTQDSLRDQVALVPQEPVLFHRSLFENIRYAKPQATRAEVIKAAKLAHCHEFIKKLPEKYDTLVGERGVKLSGGERQRVAIARAILKNAPILVLDEATSSLDSESERYIQDSLSRLMKGRTTIVIAHRLSTIMQMDRIVVIQKGKIAEDGTHDQLLKVKKGTYQKLWEIQAGGFAG
jgi:ATP-binding cassette subfamily B protein